MVPAGKNHTIHKRNSSKDLNLFMYVACADTITERSWRLCPPSWRRWRPSGRSYTRSIRRWWRRGVNWRRLRMTVDSGLKSKIFEFLDCILAQFIDYSWDELVNGVNQWKTILCGWFPITALELNSALIPAHHFQFYEHNYTGDRVTLLTLMLSYNNVITAS